MKYLSCIYTVVMKVMNVKFSLFFGPERDDDLEKKSYKLLMFAATFMVNVFINHCCFSVSPHFWHVLYLYALHVTSGIHSDTPSEVYKSKLTF